MTGRFNSVRPLLTAAGGVPALFVLCAWTGVRFNTTESLPRGLYITTARETKLVEFCPPEPFASFALSRGYRNPGSCPDGGMPLLKPVVAIAGDLVEFSERGIAVNGHFFDNTAPLTTDSCGRPLTPWLFGNYRVAPGTVWVASSYSPKSFDSRYFGPIPVAAIQDHVRPMMTGSW